jgi:hypothetical protein
MVYKELAEESGMLIVEFIGAAVDQSPESKTKYFESEKKLKIIIVEEWKKTEDRIREFYEIKG